ncbi:hypothetical protein, partial [Helicobacter suis]
GTKESYNDAVEKAIPAVLTNDIKTTLSPESKNGTSRPPPSLKLSTNITQKSKILSKYRDGSS